jgi:hypothetical protein
MKKIIVAPLALLASISLLTSCAKTDVTTPTVTTPTTTEQEGVTPVVTEVNLGTGETEASGASVIMTVTPAPLPGDAATGSTTPAPESSVTPAVAAAVTKTETLAYTTPAGSDSIEFSMTVEGGVIKSVTASPKAENDISKKRQASFAAAVQGEVVGKNIKDLDLDAVGGSSLTTAAFEKFIATF